MVLPLGNGFTTGGCVLSKDPRIVENKTYVCEINAWCPVEQDILPLEDGSALLKGIQDSTVMIKNDIQFKLYNISRRNILEDQSDDYLKTCRYDTGSNRYCPIFRLKDIIQATGNTIENFNKGGIINIEIQWNCNLDQDYDLCRPVYKFSRLDDSTAKTAGGWNFRSAIYKSRSERDLTKYYGIKFIISTTGSGGKFDFITLFLNVGSGLGLLGVVSIIPTFTYLSIHYTQVFNVYFIHISPTRRS